MRLDFALYAKNNLFYTIIYEVLIIVLLLAWLLLRIFHVIINECRFLVKFFPPQACQAIAQASKCRLALQMHILGGALVYGDRADC